MQKVIQSKITAIIVIIQCIPGNSGQVSLTVEGGVSLVGPHCPGTVRLFCEGVEQSFLEWTYNAGLHIVARVEADHEVTSSPISPGPTNPAFISVHVTNISFDSRTLLANFSSVLTVDLLELNKQNIKNISCGGLSDKDTQQVDVSDYFTPNITASYQSGILNKVEVQLVS